MGRVNDAVYRSLIYMSAADLLAQRLREWLVRFMIIRELYVIKAVLSWPISLFSRKHGESHRILAHRPRRVSPAVYLTSRKAV
jgi:hypothetical protein